MPTHGSPLDNDSTKRRALRPANSSRMHGALVLSCSRPAARAWTSPSSSFNSGQFVPNLVVLQWSRGGVALFKLARPNRCQTYRPRMVLDSRECVAVRCASIALVHGIFCSSHSTAHALIHRSVCTMNMHARGCSFYSPLASCNIPPKTSIKI
jgi:hypothetical protein